MKLSRPHHYFFAHRLLPKLFHQDASQFITLLQRDGLRFLEFWWRQAAEKMALDKRLSADGLGYVLRQLAGGWVVALVMMPLPDGMTEAYFVALLYRKEPEATRVFTLEKSVSLDPTTSPQTVLCEWTPDVTHRNMGSGPLPEQEAFLEAVAAALNP